MGSSSDQIIITNDNNSEPSSSEETPILNEQTNMPVKLISCDNMVYEISEEAAFQSGLLKSFLNPKLPFTEAKERTFVLPIRNKALLRIIDFMEHRCKWKGDTAEQQEFVIDDEEALLMVDIATYLKL
ncbi:elongin C [Conglomerata obtusa]